MDWKAELTQIAQKAQGTDTARTPSRLRFDEPMHKHTHFGIGGAARAYFEVSTAEQLSALVRLKARCGVPVAIIGRGSNLLVSDVGYSGVVVRLIGEFDQLEFDGEHVWAGAGVSLPRLSKTAARQGLSGVEFALGIPGAVGGGLIMNAGAWGSSFGDSVEGVQAMTEEGELVELSHAEAVFDYRHSGLGAYFCITGASLRLTSGDVKTITDSMNELYKRKIESQPFTEENAGCIFKNPPGDSAGRLIDVCGLKGARVRGAEVSKIHGNFILNIGNATAEDVLDLVRHIQQHVKQETGIGLEMEVKTLGFESL